MIDLNIDSQQRVTQGDIYRAVEHIEWVKEDDGVIEVSKLVFPYVVVLTQDCDLEWDFRFRLGGQKRATNDKQLLSLLVAPLYNFDHVLTGEHLSELGLRMAPANQGKTAVNYLRNNERPRYHYLEFSKGSEIPPAVVDFKHYFSIFLPHLENLRAEKFLGRLPALYREDISHRFASYLSRIGLPEEMSEGRENPSHGP